MLPAVASAAATPSVDLRVTGEALSAVVRGAPRGAEVRVQERAGPTWRWAGSAAVRGRRVALDWRGLAARDAVTLRAVLVDRRGRRLAVSSARRVVRAPTATAPTPPASPPAPADPAPSTTTPAAADPPAAQPPAPVVPVVLAADARRLHLLGADRWDVWTCGDVGTATAADAVAVLDAEVAPFYAWLSGGRHVLQFRARGALTATTVGACEAEAEGSSAGRDGALILQTTRVSAGPDACVADTSSLDPCARQPTTLPGNERIAWLHPDDLLGPDAHIATAVHELGHTLTWGHSFTGRLHVTYMGQTVGVEYDDPFDVMGYERLWGTGTWTDPTIGTFTPKATQVFDRIAAGWVPDAQIAVHAGASGTYELEPIGAAGLQAVLIPTDDPRAFLTLEARVVAPLDPVPADGVVIHAVDQRPAACDTDAEVAGCFGDEARVSPAPNTPDSLDSLVSVGESVDVAGVRVTVTARSGDRFSVRVDGARASFALKPSVCLYVEAACDGGGQGPI